MDHPPPDEGRSEHAVHKASHSGYPSHVPATQEGSIAGSDTRRYRPAPLNLRTSTPRSMGVSGPCGNYYQDSSSGCSAPPAVSSNLLAYETDYGNDTRNQAAGMGSYNSGMMMYNVPHAAAQQSVYDTQQFTPRQHAAMQMMPSDVASTYFTSEAAGNTGTQLQASGHGSSSVGPNVYLSQQQNPSLPYSNTMSGVNEVHQQQQQQQSTSPSGEEAAAAEKWASFRRQLGTVFQDISVGQLEGASETLLGTSSWLLSQIVELGLDQDNPAQHQDRLKLWNDFNHAWLALAFQQKELMDSGRKVSRSQRLMTEDTVKKMGDELIRLCDGVERHGLVDYQYGVWEEQIEAALEECLDQFERSK
ncbi:hypothetical protein E4U41_002124 [Claviceps citrina]|nr:hypothetical protein E4U41_002124 [Claviceps citrina]